MADTRKVHYRPLPLGFNPYIDYEKINDLAEEKTIENVTGIYRKIWERQEGLCECCREPIKPDDEKELFEIDPKEVYLTEKMAYIHSRCRDLMIEEDSSKDKELLDQGSSMDLLMKYSEENEVSNIEDHPLYNVFKVSEKSTIQLSFKRIGEIIGKTLPEIAYHREYWIQNAENKLCRCWLDNGYFVKKVSTSGRRYVTFYKYRFTGETGKVNIPDLLIHGEVPLRMKHRIESMLKHEFEHSGLQWE